MFWFVASSLVGCAALVAGPIERSDTLARQAGLIPVPVSVPLRAYARVGAGGKVLTIFVEGDGARWPRGMPPRDPTPEDPLALRMAIADPASTIAYLGRPCQYLEDAERAACAPELWSKARFGETAVAMSSSAIDALKAATHATSLRLVGYSGGGTLAALLASRRSDVSCLVTVASPIDIEAWVSAIGVSPLSKSFNPIKFSAQLRNVAQTHYSGGRDAVVPTAILSGYLGQQPNAKSHVIADNDHECCWAENWRVLRQNSCLGAD